MWVVMVIRLCMCNVLKWCRLVSRVGSFVGVMLCLFFFGEVFICISVLMVWFLICRW